jgi:non-heme chloroperoxidase
MNLENKHSALEADDTSTMEFETSPKLEGRPEMTEAAPQGLHHWSRRDLLLLGVAAIPAVGWLADGESANAAPRLQYQGTKGRTSMPYVTVGKENSGDIKIYYEDHGSGHPVILIHGYPLSGASWEKQVPALLGAGYRVITYDRRGFGKSSQPTTGYNYDTFAEDLHKLVTQLNLRDFSLVGFSMGGGEVARYIGKYGSKEVRGAVIIGGIPPYLLKTADNPDGVDASVFEGIKKALAADRYAFFTEFFKNFYNTDVLLGKRISQDAIQASWNVAASASATASLACVPTWYEDFRHDLARVDVPTLVIQGEADRIVPINASGQRTAKLIKGARLVVIKDGPHAVIWTHADEVNAALVNFLGRGVGNHVAATAQR